MNDPAKLAAELLYKNWPKFGSFLSPVVYTSIIKGEYDTYSGEVGAPTKETKEISVAFVEFSYTKTTAATMRSSKVEILAEDMNVIFPALHFPFLPSIDDTLTEENGRSWVVVARSKDPKPVHYELHVRPLKNDIG